MVRRRSTTSSVDRQADAPEGGTGRRDLLRAGAGVAAVAWLAGGTACSDDAKSSSGKAADSAPSPSGSSGKPAGSGAKPTGNKAAAAPPKAADWAAFGRDLDGGLVRPGDSDYTSAHRLFQPQFDGTKPAAVAYPSHAKDVQTCLAFARKFGVPVAVRSGGHSYTGWSSGTGVVIDVSALKKVTSGSTATVGSGARLIDVYGGLAAHGLTIPAGSCPTVGVAGLTLGGGVGVTSRAYGLTCDNLTGAEIVTADGRILQADAQHNADLFWALRGGGGGNFGVVTQFRFRTHPARDCSYAFLSWPWSKAAAVIKAWQNWAPKAPDALWANLHLSASTGRTPQVSVGANYLGTQSGLRNQLDRLTDAVGSQPTSSTVRTRPYLDTMLVMAGCSGWSPAQCHLPGRLPGQNAAGKVTRESYAARSDFYTKALSTAGIKALLASVERYTRTSLLGGSGSVAFDALGGAPNRIKPQDTAFVHRDALFMAQYIANWPGGTNASGVDRSHAWLDGLWKAMRPYASGQAYQNYPDPKLTDWKKAYYGANQTRLAQIKTAYDPDHLFRFPQGV